MKYFQLYGDIKRSRFIYYGEDGKIYKYKKNVGNYKLGGAYLIVFTIVSIFLRHLDTLFHDLLTLDLCIKMVLLGTVFSILIGVILSHANTKELRLNLQEFPLTKEQFEKYVSDGKQQFIKQLCIFYFLLVLSVFALGFFIYTQEITFLISGLLLTVVSVFMIISNTPLRKYRFFKNFSKDKK